MLASLHTHGPVVAAFTDRFGGVSPAPYDELSLSVPAAPQGAAGTDWEAVVAENLRRATAALAHRQGSAGVPPHPALMRQVHGAEVVEVDEGWTPQAPVPKADGLVTRRRDVALVVRVADCVPVLLADVSAGVVGAAHAGRAGLVAGVVPETVRRMRGLGAGDLVAWVGPSICGGCYEVPAALRDEVGRVVPAAPATTTWGTPSLDVGAGVLAQLASEGVRAVQVAGCSREDADLYSHRRDGASSGRFGGLVWLGSEST